MTLDVSSMLAKLSSAGMATSNRYAVQMQIPSKLQAQSEFNIDGYSLGEVLNFYCDSVTTPTKQVTTAQHRDHGVGINYATGTVYGEVTLNLLSPKDLDFNRVFEEWYAAIHDDTGNKVSYYDDIVAPKMTIYKLEKNGKKNSKWSTSITGRWEIENALPYNISPYQLSSARTQLLKTRISFKVERYRFVRGGAFSLAAEVLGNVSRFDD